MLRRHVVQCSAGGMTCSLGTLDTAGESEIDYLDGAIRENPDVLRCNVAVDDAITMHMIQALGDLLHDLHSLFQRDRGARTQALGEILAFQVLHDKVGDAVLDVGGVDGDHVGMIEFSSSSGLLAKAF